MDKETFRDVAECLASEFKLHDIEQLLKINIIELYKYIDILKTQFYNQVNQKCLSHKSFRVHLKNSFVMTLSGYQSASVVKAWDDYMVNREYA